MKKLKFGILSVSIVLTMSITSCSTSNNVSENTESTTEAETVEKEEEPIEEEVVDNTVTEELSEIETIVDEVEVVTKTYVGSVDEYPIHMTLNYTGDTLEGAYYYDSYGIDIPLTGTVNNQFIEITTLDDTEIFSGVEDEGSISGIWKGNGNSLDFYLVDETQKGLMSELFFKDLEGLDFHFSSGAGAWGTYLELGEGGTFFGEYHDSDMGDIGEGYPNGTQYYCEFDGKFVLEEKIDDYTYLLTLEELNYEIPENEIIEGVYRVYTDPYGVEGDDKFILCLPGKPLSELSETVVSWGGFWIYGDETQIQESYDCYILYGTTTEQAFYNYGDLN
ncbi:MAG: hypothetical protein ACK5LY_02745 [Lachnospirales bacterium]